MEGLTLLDTSVQDHLNENKLWTREFVILLGLSFLTFFKDLHIRVYNYNTMERVHMFEAHTDYIRFSQIARPNSVMQMPGNTPNHAVGAFLLRRYVHQTLGLGEQYV